MTAEKKDNKTQSFIINALEQLAHQGFSLEKITIPHSGNLDLFKVKWINDEALSRQHRQWNELIDVLKNMTEDQRAQEFKLASEVVFKRYKTYKYREGLATQVPGISFRLKEWEPCDRGTLFKVLVRGMLDLGVPELHLGVEKFEAHEFVNVGYKLPTDDKGNKKHVNERRLSTVAGIRHWFKITATNVYEQDDEDVAQVRLVKSMRDYGKVYPNALVLKRREDREK